MVWTDPPWGVGYVDARGRELLNDHRGEELERTVHASLRLALEATRPGGAIYLVHGEGGARLRDVVADVGWELHQTLVWVKNTFVLGRQDYHWQHETILYGWRPGAAHRFRAARTETTVVDDEPDVGKLSRRELVALVRKLRNERGTTVVREDKPARNDLHPTTKPVGLVASQVANSSGRGDVVYDPFAGSGSTLIACENIGRHARLVELDPGYCDVIVDRWQRHTGRQAELERKRRRARAGV
jgi:DNA modification methylase